MAEDTGMSELLGAMALKVDFKMSFHKDAMAEYSEIKRVIDGVAKDKEKLQQEKEVFQNEKERFQTEKEMLQHEQHANGEALASKDTLKAARDAILTYAEEISLKTKYIEFLKKKLEESEAKNNQVEQQCGSVMDLMQPRMQTRSTQKRKRPSEGILEHVADKTLEYGTDENEHTGQLVLSKRLLGNDAVNVAITKECPGKELVDNPRAGQTSSVLVSEEDLEVVRDDLIKGFLEIDMARRKIGIKEMGLLNEKAFKAACLAKLPPEEVGTACHELYSSWQQQLGDLSWRGSGAHNAVVNALVEMKEYGRLSDRSIAYELWNHKEGRRATTRECVDYMSNQVKQLSATKRRKNRWLRGGA